MEKAEHSSQQIDDGLTISATTTQQEVDDQNLPHNLTKKLSVGQITLSNRPASPAIDEPVPKIENLEYLASYTILPSQNEIPTIHIPGIPPTWHPRKHSWSVKYDRGDFFRDVNAANFPTHPLAPVITSIKYLAPEKASQIDILACSSTLGHLMRMARGEERGFSFEIARLDSTVVFLRKDGDPTTLIPDVKGYGHEFLKNYTRWEDKTDGIVGEGASHQRIVMYDFGGMKIACRAQVDGYCPEDYVKERTSSEEELMKISLTQAEPATIDEEFSIVQQGRRVPQNTILDVKTRSSKIVFDMNEILPRLWLLGISKFVLAYHTFGVFDDVEVKDISEDIQEWEAVNEAIITKFGYLLKEIMGFVSLQKKDWLGVLARKEGSDNLEIEEHSEENVGIVSKELKDRWVGQVADDDEYFGYDSPGGYDSDYESHFQARDYYGSSDDEVKDFAACSADDCGYCGRCMY
jgi:hypothetical protein